MSPYDVPAGHLQWRLHGDSISYPLSPCSAPNSLRYTPVARTTAGFRVKINQCVCRVAYWPVPGSHAGKCPPMERHRDRSVPPGTEVEPCTHAMGRLQPVTLYYHLLQPQEVMIVTRALQERILTFSSWSAI